MWTLMAMVTSSNTLENDHTLAVKELNLIPPPSYCSIKQDQDKGLFTFLFVYVLSDIQQDYHC